jgi:hypothetical protein
MTFVFVLFRNQLPVIGGVIFIGGIFYAARFFREIHTTANGIYYFMIPATQLEKVTVSVFFTSVYYFVMMVLAYTIGNLFGTFLNNLLTDVDFLSTLGLFHHDTLNWRLFEQTEILQFEGDFSEAKTASYVWLFFKAFLSIQSLFILGGIWFKNNQTFKTIFFIIGICIIFLIIGVFGIKMIEHNTIQLNHIVGKIFTVFFYLLAPFLWVVSYFRLTEKEV